MWVLKYQYVHDDCLYTKKAQQLQMAVSTYPLNHFTKKKTFYVSALHLFEGEQPNIERFVRYITKRSDYAERISNNMLFTLISLRKNASYYKLFYNPYVLYPVPILHKGGREYIQIASWQRSRLSMIITALQKNKYTRFFNLLSFKEEPLQEMFLLNALPSLTVQQRRGFDFALKNGYYAYPRNIPLGKLASLMRLSKSSYHEVLRRAESHLMPYFAKMLGKGTN